MSSLNFELGAVWNADNLDVMRGMNSETVDLIYLDPPFKNQKRFQSAMTHRAENLVDGLGELLRLAH